MDRLSIVKVKKSRVNSWGLTVRSVGRRGMARSSDTAAATYIDPPASQVEIRAQNGQKPYGELQQDQPCRSCNVEHPREDHFREPFMVDPHPTARRVRVRVGGNDLPRLPNVLPGSEVTPQVRICGSASKDIGDHGKDHEGYADVPPSDKTTVLGGHFARFTR